MLLGFRSSKAAAKSGGFNDVIEDNGDEGSMAVACFYICLLEAFQILFLFIQVFSISSSTPHTPHVHASFFQRSHRSTPRLAKQSCFIG